jgi:hypothetical protein
VSAYEGYRVTHRFTADKIHLTPELCGKINAARLDVQAVCDNLVARHQEGDWGEISDHQQVVNDIVVEVGKGVVKSVYSVDDVGEVWLMTSFNTQRKLGAATFVMLAGQNLAL